MSSITLITGSLDEICDPNERLDYSELYYESYRNIPDDDDFFQVFREAFPVRRYGDRKSTIVQYLGSGKTLMGMQLLAEKAVRNEEVAANLALVWHNNGISHQEWHARINEMGDFLSMKNCTILLDDIRSTISHFQCKEAAIVSEIANAGRKLNIDFISTAQREAMFPKDLRDMCTEWIVPVIRIRDMTKWTPDNTGKPIEMLALHFDGTKNFLHMSQPYRGLDRLFESYHTLQRAIGLKADNTTKKSKNVFLKD